MRAAQRRGRRLAAKLSPPADNDEEDCRNCAEDCGDCCGDGRCDGELGEDIDSCPSDCEEGQDGGGPASDSNGGDDSQSATSKRIFLTANAYTGKLVSNGTTGIAAGDKICNEEAQNGSLGGTWKAWLSDSSSDAIDRIVDVGPWVLLDGTLVFRDKSALETYPEAPIDISASGNITNHGYALWTGTKADGTATATNCSDWTNDIYNGMGDDDGMGGSGKVGSTNSHWTYLGETTCAGEQQLICIEQ